MSASNSYSNNKNFLDKNFVTKCEMYRSGKKDFKYEKDDDNKKEDKKDDKKDDQKIKEDSKKMLEGKGREDFITGGKLPDNATTPPKTI